MDTWNEIEASIRDEVENDSANRNVDLSDSAGCARYAWESAESSSLAVWESECRRLWYACSEVRELEAELRDNFAKDDSIGMRIKLCVVFALERAYLSACESLRDSLPEA